MRYGYDVTLNLFLSCLRAQSRHGRDLKARYHRWQNTEWPKCMSRNYNIRNQSLTSSRLHRMPQTSRRTYTGSKCRFTITFASPDSEAWPYQDHSLGISWFFSLLQYALTRQDITFINILRKQKSTKLTAKYLTGLIFNIFQSSKNLRIFCENIPDQATDTKNSIFVKPLRVRK